MRAARAIAANRGTAAAAIGGAPHLRISVLRQPHAFASKRTAGQRELALVGHFLGGEGFGPRRCALAAEHEDHIVHQIGKLGVVGEPAVRDIGQAQKIRRAIPACT